MSDEQKPDPLKIDTPQEIARFEAFKKLWVEMHRRGESNEWIEWTNDYPGSTLELKHPSERERERLVVIRQHKEWQKKQEASEIARRKQEKYDATIAAATAKAQREIFG